MPFWELYKQRDTIAEFELNHELGEVELLEKNNSEMPTDKIYSLLVYCLIPHIILKLNNTDLISQLFVFLQDLKDENYHQWSHKSKMPNVKQFRLFLFSNQPYLEEPPKNNSLIKIETDLFNIYLYFLIHFFEKIEDKIEPKSFLHEIIEVKLQSEKSSKQELLEKINHISITYYQKIGF